MILIPAQAITLEFNKNKYKAKIYGQMALMTGFCFLSAFLLSKAKIGFLHNYKRDYILVTIIFSILMIAIMIALANKCKKSCEQNESKLKQYGFAYAFVFLASLSVSGALIIYDAKSAIYSFAAACLVFLGSAIYAHNSKKPNLEKSLLHHGFKISLGVIALCLVNLFIGSSAVHTAISIMCFALIVIIEILNSMSIDKKLEEIKTSKDADKKNYDLNNKEKVAENLVPYAALCLFSQIISYFLMIIEALGKKQSNQKSSSIIDFIPNLSVDGFNLAEPFEKLESTITI